MGLHSKASIDAHDPPRPADLSGVGFGIRVHQILASRAAGLAPSLGHRCPHHKNPTREDWIDFGATQSPDVACTRGRATSRTQTLGLRDLAEGVEWIPNGKFSGFSTGVIEQVEKDEHG